MEKCDVCSELSKEVWGSEGKQYCNNCVPAGLKNVNFNKGVFLSKKNFKVRKPTEFARLAQRLWRIENLLKLINKKLSRRRVH